MSARSFARAHARRTERLSRRARRLSAGAAAAVGVGLVVAPAASADTYPVTNLDPDGAGSLDQALDDANAHAGADVVTFASGLTGTISLNAPLEITDPVDVQGPGASAITVDGDNASGSVLEVSGLPAAAQPVRISGLTLANGNSGPSGHGGGGIYSGAGSDAAADLTLDAVVVRGGESKYGGGGIFVDGGSLTIRDSRIAGNNATNGSSNNYGGGLYVQSSDGPVTISGSTFRGNLSEGDGGAAYFLDVGGDVSLRQTTVTGNSSNEDGGGMVFGANAGNLTIDSSTFTGNTSSPSGAGGAIWLLGSGPATITDSTLTGNIGGYGGGIADYDSYDNGVVIRNSTITGNEATDTSEYGGGGISWKAYDDSGEPGVDTLAISSTIVAGNQAPKGPDLSAAPIPPAVPAPAAIDVGFSLIGDSAGAPINGTGPNQLGVDPKLGPLTDNGGPTLTMLPATDSPAIDAGTANGLTVDQRGLPRTVKRSFSPAADSTDIGAVELGDSGLEGGSVKAKKTQPQKGKKVVVKISATASEEPLEADASGTVKAGKKKVKLKAVKTRVDAGKTKKLTLKPKKKNGSKAILKVLDAGKKAKSALTVKLTDPAGNTETDKLNVKLK